MSSQKANSNNGPHISFKEFEVLFNQLKTWDQYTPATLERGALNYITPTITSASAKEVKTGEIINLALAWNTVPGLDNQKPALHYMSEMTDVDDMEPKCNMDFIGVDFHGKAVTHMDAMTHISYLGKLFGGKDSKVEVTSQGSNWSTIDKLGPFVTRGVLLDAALMREVSWLEPGTAIHKEDVLAMESKFGFKIGEGDCILLHAGHHRRQKGHGMWDPSDFSAGFHFDVMELFKERKVSVIGADGDSDVRPSPVEGTHSPIHALALPGMGIPLLDNVYLEELADHCAQAKRWTFQIVVAPLKVPGGTGSPVNPVAIF